MHDYAKPTVWDFDLDHIILNCGTSDPNADRTSSQAATEIIDPALSLKSDKNEIWISLLTPGSDKLNNKASEGSEQSTNQYLFLSKPCLHRSFQFDSAKSHKHKVRCIWIDMGQ